MGWVGVALLWSASVGSAHAEEPRVEVPDYKTVDSALSRTLATPSCPANGIVAFTAVGSGHVSQGAATLLGYSGAYSNVGGAWTPGGGTFIAPCAGLYVFTVSLVNDPYYNGGTNDDVYSCLTQNGESKGCAMAGQTRDGDRMTGTHTVALVLEPGDYVQSFASSDGSYKRNILRYEFTGFLVKSIGTPNP
ncbi:C1q-like domain-containing protein [Archangium primigenium]|uniref:C1q-like domain-containing protein n=1 Tax=[Archangium] primigenium TaxID=2792470 RepID=UPI0019586D1E|nr:hypothetical protein [Archangium primigenium]